VTSLAKRFVDSIVILLVPSPAEAASYWSSQTSDPNDSRTVQSKNPPKESMEFDPYIPMQVDVKVWDPLGLGTLVIACNCMQYCKPIIFRLHKYVDPLKFSHATIWIRPF
jgi:hypothetical protein